MQQCWPQHKLWYDCPPEPRVQGSRLSPKDKLDRIVLVLDWQVLHPLGFDLPSQPLHVLRVRKESRPSTHDGSVGQEAAECEIFLHPQKHQPRKAMVRYHVGQLVEYLQDHFGDKRVLNVEDCIDSEVGIGIQIRTEQLEASQG